MSLFHLLPTSRTSTGPAYNLTGTSGSPTNRSQSSLDPADARVRWVICGATGANNTTKGRVMYDTYDAGDAVSFTTEHSWVVPNAGWTTMYVRLTDNGSSGSATLTPISHAIDGTTWHTITEDSTTVGWTVGLDSVESSAYYDVKVELATDSGGSNIVATGYYRGTVTVFT